MQLIRFVREKEHLIDDIKNGFLLRNHEVNFRSNKQKLIHRILEIYEETNFKSDVLDDILEYKRKNIPFESSKYSTENTIKGGLLNFIFSNSKNFIKMKSFTELRDNQKINKSVFGYFGDYGISVCPKWAVTEGASPVIYVGEKLEITNRLSVIISLLRTMVNSSKVESAIFDLISMFEQEEHYGEFEYRIVKSNKIEGNEPDRVKIPKNKILEIFVPNKNEKAEFELLFKNEEFKPKISLTRDIMLNDEEINIVNNINSR